MIGNKRIAFLYMKNSTISVSENLLIEALMQRNYDDVDVIDLSLLLNSANSTLYEGIKRKILAADCVYISNYVARFMHVDVDIYMSKIISRKIDSAKYLRLLLDAIYKSDSVIIATTCCFDPMDVFLIKYIDDFCKDGATTYLNDRVESGQKDAYESFHCDFEKLRTVSRKLSALKVKIELHHCIGLDELIDMDKYRFRKVVVPGAGYVRRSSALKSLSTLDRFLTPKCYPVKVALMMANKTCEICKHNLPFQYAYRFANFYHKRMLGESAMVYTDGSKLDLPVRKFFEIPAAGCLLLCTPFNGMSDLGFKDGFTHIECAPEDVGQLVNKLDLRSAGVREIIRRGQELVRLKHSANAQAGQLVEALRRAAAGTLKSALWREGEYVYQ